MWVQLARHLADPDASVAALGGAWGRRLGGDDRRMRSVLAAELPEVEVVGTVALLKTAATRLRWKEDERGEMYAALRERACFVVPRR